MKQSLDKPCKAVNYRPDIYTYDNLLNSINKCKYKKPKDGITHNAVNPLHGKLYPAKI
jgi:hypothetical protein